MANGIIEGVTSREDVRYRVEWETETLHDENATRAAAKIFYYSQIARTGKLSCRMTLGGVTQSKSVSGGLVANTWVEGGALSAVIVSHNVDGTGEMTVSGSATVSGVSFSFSQTVALETVDCASRLTLVSDTVAGELCAVSWQTRSSEFSHRLRLNLGEWQSETALTATEGDVHYEHVALPLEAAVGLTHARVGTASATLLTYYKGNLLGTPHTLEFRVILPDCEALRPTLSLAAAPVNAYDAVFDGLYVQGKTPVAAEVVAAGRYGAEVSVTVTLEGKHYAAPYLTESPTSAGELTLTAVATDTRGLVTETAYKITVLPYTVPLLCPVEGESAVRCCRAENGVAGTRGEQLYLAVRPTCESLAREGTPANSVTLEYRIRPLTGGVFGEWQTLGRDVAFCGAVEGVTLSTDTSYAVELSALDLFGERSVRTFTVSTEEVSFHLRAGGMGAAFGKYAEEARVLEIASDWTLRLHGNLDDTVTLTDTATLDGEGGYCRLCVRGGKHVSLSLGVPLVFTGESVVLCEGLVPDALLPARPVRGVCVGETGELVTVCLQPSGTLSATHVYTATGQETATFACLDVHLCWEV